MEARPSAVTTAMEQTAELPRGMTGERAGAVPAADGAPAPPSEPPQRPEVPFTEDQAENNARLQLKQDELLAAFPRMTRQDIVECDGNLDVLAGLVADGAGMTREAARARIDDILGTSSKKIGSPVIPEGE